VHVSPEEMDRAAETIGGVDGVEEVLSRDEAAATLQLPADRIGDLVVLAGADTAVGRAEREHDLGALHGALRSHGGRHEQAVPILLSERNDGADGASNSDVFHLLIGVAE
jgi:phosphonoacetate hydrolase